MPTYYDEMPDLSRLLDPLFESYRKRPTESFLTVEDLAGALSGIPMEPGAAPDVSGAIEGLGQAASRLLPATTGYRMPMPTSDAIPATEPGGEGFGLAGVMAQEPEWRPIPGDPTGKFRDPGTGTRFKGGPLYASSRPAGVPEWQPPPGRYGGAAAYLNDLDRASDTRLNLFKRFSAMDPTEARVRMYQKTGLDKPFWSSNDLFKQIVELPSIESDARMAETQKILGAITEKEQQRRENAWLMQQIMGSGVTAPPGGVSEKTLKTGTTLTHEKRAQEAAERADRRLAGIERQQGLARPNEAALTGRAQRILAEKGHTAKQIEKTWYVYKGSNSRTPIANSEQAWAAAMKRAEAELRSGAP